ncbi:MAG: helix-turn-helix domain-containing protein [Clostridia bacterium]|nr:helix-turn-helix domain-containing protein [Clostridia bacterium]MBQ8836463.1 helix-turn-helix domain-containing protein [Clostridia bacterium]
MSNLYKNIVALCESKGITGGKMCTDIGISKGLLTDLKKGRRSGVSAVTAQKIAAYFGVSVGYLLGKEEIAPKTTLNLQLFASDDIPKDMLPIKTKKLPLLGEVACGDPKYADEHYEAYISADEDIQADFCLRAKGDSMINARIFDGDILFVKSQTMVDDGEIAVIRIEDETTVKRVYYDKENNVITLVPENPTFKPMRYEGEQLDHIAILGKVVSGQYPIE